MLAQCLVKTTDFTCRVPLAAGRPIDPISLPGVSMKRGRNSTKNKPAPVPSILSGQWAVLVRALNLSARQAKIVDLILQGKKDKEIAKELGLSKYTIRTYLNRIFSRLEVTDRLGLVVKVFARCRENCAQAGCPYKV
ncbi:MAG: LuxR C-terminal-related transcriptional regulator [Tepidisphaeraceae bacterium]